MDGKISTVLRGTRGSFSTSLRAFAIDSTCPFLPAFCLRITPSVAPSMSSAQRAFCIDGSTARASARHTLGAAQPGPAVGWLAPRAYRYRSSPLSKSGGLLNDQTRSRMSGKPIVRFCEGSGYNPGCGRDIAAPSGNQAANRKHQRPPTVRGVPDLRKTPFCPLVLLQGRWRAPTVGQFS